MFSKNQPIWQPDCFWTLEYQTSLVHILLFILVFERSQLNRTKMRRMLWHWETLFLIYKSIETKNGIRVLSINCLIFYHHSLTYLERWSISSPYSGFLDCGKQFLRTGFTPTYLLSTNSFKTYFKNFNTFFVYFHSIFTCVPTGRTNSARFWHISTFKLLRNLVALGSPWHWLHPVL
jgi:hypothetical protein